MGGAVLSASTAVAWAVDRRQEGDLPDLICRVLAKAAHQSVAFSAGSAVPVRVRAVSPMLEPRRERRR